MRYLTSLLFLPILALSASFTSGPTVVKDGLTATISFTVSEMTDIEVAVKDENGKTLRHLAAGVLGGEFAAPAPLQSGLSQTLVWDGHDDNGNTCYGINYKIQVKLGVIPTYDTTFHSKDIFPSTYLGYPGGLDPKYTYRPANDPFLAMKSFNGTALYEQEQRIEISADNNTGHILVNGVADGQGLGKNSASVFRIDGKTGKVLQVINGTTKIFDSTAHYEGQGRANYDWEGKYYYYRCANNVYRFDLDGKPAPWPQTGSHVVKNLPFNDIGSAGISAGPDSSVYVVHYTAHDTIDPQCISKIKNGVIVKSKFIRISGSMAGGVRVDKNSNIYIGARIKELSKPWPDFVNSDSLSGTICELETSQKAWAYEMYGSVLKFDSTGGSILYGTTGNLVTGGGGFHPGNCATWQSYHKCSTQGLIWMHYGMSHILTHTTYRITKCWCAQSRFDVDGYGRVFYPNTFMCEFAGIDNSKNMLFRIKNRDLPDGVAIGVGSQIEVTDEALYVVDYYNNKIVRFDWKADTVWNSSAMATASENRETITLTTEILVQPNPFNPSCKISITLPSSINATLAIYSTDGKLIKILKSGSIEKGVNAFSWDGKDRNGNESATGIYLCKLSNGKSSAIKRITMIR
ncbi:MAG: T9SS type A sorting domain-containing protein [Fibrobacteres bacterium]|nr:T9SS type A sorting domain-containing protein [Fibrobacterota bacterium]